MTIREAGQGIVISSSWPKSYLIGFNNGDETELDATSLSDLEKLWNSLYLEFGSSANAIDYVVAA